MSTDLTAIIIAATTAVLALMGYLAKRYVDFKLHAVSKLHEAKFDAVVELKGLLVEIDHALNHVSDGDSEYVDVVRLHCTTARKASRANSALLGNVFVDKVRFATDVALQFTEDHEPGLLRKWHSFRDELYSKSDQSIRTVDFRPSAR